MILTHMFFGFVLMFSISALIPSALVAQSETLNEVVNLNTPVPGGAGNFTSLSSKSTSIGSGDLVFVGSDGQEVGIFAYRDSDGTLEKLVGESDFHFTLTTFTNSEVPFFTFRSFNAATIIKIGEGDFAFAGTFGSSSVEQHEGIWTYIDGELSLVADTNLVIPGGEGFLDRFDLSLDTFSYVGNNQLLFTGRAVGDFFNRGVYLYDIATKQRSVVIDTNAVTPMGGFAFLGFDLTNVSLPDEGFVFKGYLPYNQGEPFNWGYFGYQNGTVFHIIDTLYNYQADGEYFEHVGGGVLLESGNIIFSAHYDDGLVSKTEIYLYDVTDGSLTLLIDEITTEFPSGGPVVNLYRGSFGLRQIVSLENGDDFAMHVTYDGRESGIYAYINGTLSTIAQSTDTVIPGDSVNFRYFQDLIALEGGGIAFAGGLEYRDIRGIYGFTGGSLTVFADISDITGFGTTGTGLKPYGLNGVSFRGFNTFEDPIFHGRVFTEPSIYTASPGSARANSNLNFLGISPATSNAQNTIDFAGAAPGQRIIITWGFVSQSDQLRNGPCAGASSDIKRPRIFRTKVADSTGNMSQAVFIPANFSGVSIIVQGVVEDTCESSNAQSVTFQ